MVEAAIVGLVGALVGILLSNVLRVYFDWRNRRERVRDIQTALRAEIRSHRRSLEDFEDDSGIDGVMQRIQADPAYTPFITKEIDPPIFSAIVGDVHILPGSVIDAVVIYYRQARSLAGMTEDMRGQAFTQLPALRKAEMYRDYVAMGLFGLELADDALQAIEDSLASGAAR